MAEAISGGEYSPVAGQERIATLDVLRGFAVLGILVMNIQSFSMIGAAYMNPTSYGDLSGANYVVWFLSHLVADSKFMGLFSLLFGAGIVLMAERRANRGKSIAGFHYRRIFWLFVIGLVHAYCIWYGDILVTYATTAAVVFWAWRLRPRWLVPIAIVMLMVGSGLSIVSGVTIPKWDPKQRAEMEGSWAPSEEKIQEELEIMRGSWLGQMPKRAKASLFFETFLWLFLFFWRAGGLMLLGMAAYKLGLLDGKRSRRFYLAMTIVCGLVGFPIIVYGIWQHEQYEWAFEYSFFLGPQFNYWGSLLIVFAYVGLISLACKSTSWGWLTDRLAKVGRMALTNYLTHSVIGTLIFYGHGLGYFGTFSRVQQIGLVFVIFVCQVFLSDWWLARFRFGPLEWLWRSLTYWKLQPMKVDHVSMDNP